MTKRVVVLLLVMIALAATSGWAQRTTGSISGQVLDPTSAVVPGAKITITNPDTGFKIEMTSSGDGTFTAPDLTPGGWKVTIVAPGFKTYETLATVRVGVVMPITAKLELGVAAATVLVESAAVSVDLTKATVQGVITGERIQDIPLNGRNFLDLAQQEPGVQIVDGGNFDPTKNQFVGVSIGGRSGRVTRIQVDGVDITDETVGTTVANISNESISEFGIQQSTLDPSTDVTSSGAVNIITKGGTNTLHGSAAFFFRNESLAADQRLSKTGDKPPFDREIIAARAGGPFLPDRWFWHAEYEYNNQDAQRIVEVPEFPQFSGAFGVPLDERMTGGRTDYILTNKVSGFYRFMHNYNFGVTGFGARDLGAFANLNNTNIHMLGVDYRGSRWTHSGRFAYLNFNNFIVPANTAAGTPDTLDPGGQPVLIRINLILHDVGPDLLAPQRTFQDNKQSKYDASVIWGRHTISLGAEYNHIEQFVYAAFYGLSPRLRASRTTATRAFANTNPFASGGDLNPLNYPLNQLIIGNGLGYFSEKPALGFPFGGTVNHRWAFYVHDAWKVSSNFTLNLGLRYTWHSSFSNHDLERASLIGVFDPSLSGFPNRDANDFGPQAGFAWNVLGNNKFVIRAGAGIFYETNIFNNLLFDRVANIPPGIGYSIGLITASAPLLLDPSTGATLFDYSTDCTGLPGNNCIGAALGSVIPFAIQGRQMFQAASQALAAGWPQPGAQPLFNTELETHGNILDPRYKTPYGAQMNAGFQWELRPGLVVSADYTRNRGVHFNLIRDRNRLGAANTLDTTIAASAIAATLSDYACATIDCVILAGGSIGDFTDNGLGAGSAVDGYAFRGMNSNFRGMGVIEPQGLSLYQGLQVRLLGDLPEWRAFKKTRINVTYSLSRFESTGVDQDFLSGAGFNDRPTKFFGPANLDRTSQVGLTFITHLPWNFVISSTSAFRSALPSSLFLPDVTGGADEIFFTDVDGDGVTLDPLLMSAPRGAFSRAVKTGDLSSLIDDYNNNVILQQQLSPAALALVNAGLFTETQLRALGATLGGCSTADRAANGCAAYLIPNDGAVNNDSFFNTDVRLAYRLSIRERVVIEPYAEVFNLFNIANYTAFSTTLYGSPGTANGTTQLNRPTRVGAGSGSFAPGVQRAFQFGVRVSF